MSGRQPRKVDCADGSTTSVVAVVMVSLFGHVDGDERIAGELIVGGNGNFQILIWRLGSGQWTN
jgi:hypothetical protein